MVPEDIPISDDILKSMVGACEGDKELLFKKAKGYVQKNEHEVRMAKWLAVKPLLKKHGSLARPLQENTRASSEIKQILSSARFLQKMLPKIPVSKSPSEAPTSGLHRHLEIYMLAIENWENSIIPKGEGYDVAGEKLGKYHEFQDLLEHHIKVFESIQASLSSLKKRGPPNTAKALAIYIEEISKMYTAITDKKFTACEYGDTDYFTEGMKFAKEAMAAFRTGTSGFSDANFQNACAYVVKQSPLLGKKKTKKG